MNPRILLCMALPLASMAAVESEDHWSGLPFLAEEAQERGAELPLPLGLTLNAYAMQQDYEIDDLAIGFGGSAAAVPGVSGEDLRGEDLSLTLRLDAWVLPFLDVYAVAGVIEGTNTLTVQIANPSISPLPISFPFEIDRTGVTIGGGLTLAYGWDPLWVSVDANYTYTDMDVTDGTQEALVISPRIGLRGELGPVSGQVYIGAMYQDIRQVVSGNVGGIAFRVDQSAKDPVNALVGLRWTPNATWQVGAEAGFIGRRHVLLNLGYRF